ncbi:MAG: efflux RND transporter permease subunit [Candidatus Polarisedimenticolaceae bacterium]|nr:efflux RND transporter permease subunit [Candidatus Polarisedimenticolaceae bacterium]
MLKRFLTNHVLANLTFVIVLAMGALSYLQMPSEQDPEINFNWISISTALPGASAEDVEKLITNPLEEAAAKISDVKFVQSSSRESISDITLRFIDLDDRTFDKRISDLRREIQNKANTDLPDEAEDPYIFEITSSNSFPTALIIVSGQADNEVLRRNALVIKEDLERIKGVNGVRPAALHKPEIVIRFQPEKLQQFGVSATTVATTVQASFKDISAGVMQLQSQEWLVRVLGTDAAPEYIASLPILTTQGEVPLSELAQVSRARADAKQLVQFDAKPAVMLAITKKSHTNTLELVERLNDYIAQQNSAVSAQGINILLLDDQTVPTRTALNIMQTNALFGLLLVTLVTWVFLGSRIAFFIGIGIPFTLAGTFWVLNMTGSTLNVSVLLGLVLVLGMLVDDAVVVVEAIYYRIQRGTDALQASQEALVEVFTPVTAAIITTMAAFLPLMLLPGILGDFMFVIPFVVTIALAISLLEAYWMLPVHVSASRVNFNNPSRVHRWRVKITHRIRINYCRLLIKVLRRPLISLTFVMMILLSAGAVFTSDMIRVQFFAFDPLRMFYINVIMPPGTPLEETMRRVQQVEDRAKKHLNSNEIRGLASAAGQMFTENEPYFGSRYGQVSVSLLPKREGMRSVDEITKAMRAEVLSNSGEAAVSFLILSGGPPTDKPIKVKVRGDHFEQLREVTDRLWDYLKTVPAVHDIADDDSPGKQELRLRLNQDAVKRAGLHPADVARTIRLLFDGEVLASMQHQGEKLELRLRALSSQYQDIDQLLQVPLTLPSGGTIPLRAVVTIEVDRGKANIRHYNFRRTITLSADLDKSKMNTVEANRLLLEEWQRIKKGYPGVNLDFTGELEDIQESIEALGLLMLFGLGLIYLILGTQFRSYFQPILILVTVPMAFSGVVFGLLVTQNPLSLYTLYGVVALVGIAVNAAIVMIDAANQRLIAGMSVLHATLYAARRRVIPIIITSLTTIAGLFSLAMGFGGKSLMWGPVASAIVWGLGFSTVLTLFVIPLLYRTFMQRSHLNRRLKPTAKG